MYDYKAPRERCREDAIADALDIAHEYRMRNDPDYFWEEEADLINEIKDALTVYKKKCEQYDYDFEEEVKLILDMID